MDQEKIKDIASRANEALKGIEKQIQPLTDENREHFSQISWLMEVLKNEAGLPSDLGDGREKWQLPY